MGSIRMKVLQKSAFFLMGKFSRSASVVAIPEQPMSRLSRSMSNAAVATRPLKDQNRLSPPHDGTSSGKMKPQSADDMPTEPNLRPRSGQQRDPTKEVRKLQVSCSQQCWWVAIAFLICLLLPILH